MKSLKDQVRNKRILITGGRGFLGSHIVDALKDRNEVLVYDDLSNPAISKKRENVTYFNENVLNSRTLIDSSKNIDLIFHYAASPSVKKSSEDPVHDFRHNVRGTINVLEAIRRNDIGGIVFSSSSTVYGDAEEIPTPESAPLNAISIHGASKASSEMYIKSYSSTYGIRATILRYANIFGPRQTHGVTRDFYYKLKEDPERLEILGDGSQRKSYLYVSDCVNATLKALEAGRGMEIFNIGSEEQITVTKIAEIVSEELGFNPKFEYTGRRRGWKGDVPEMLLDISKIKKLDWKPEVSIEEGIRRYIRWLEGK